MAIKNMALIVLLVIGILGVVLIPKYIDSANLIWLCTFLSLGISGFCFATLLKLNSKK